MNGSRTLRTPAVIILMMVSFISTHAQDLIVNWKGDSIACKIIEVDDQHVSYMTMEEDSLETEFLVPKNMIDAALIDFYTPTPIQLQAEETTENEPVLRFLIRGGMARLIQSDQDPDPQIRSHQRALEQGPEFGAEVTIRTAMPFDLGVVWSQYRASSQSSSILTEIGTEEEPIDMRWSDELRLDFIGVKFAYPFVLGEKGHQIELNVAPGILDYRNEVFRSEEQRLDGASVGLQAGIDYDHMLSEHFGLSIQFRALMGSIETVERFDGVRSDLETIDLTLDRMAVSFGLVWYPWSPTARYENRQ